MDHIVNLVLGDQLIEEGGGEVVRDVGDHLVHPLDRLNQLAALLLVQDGGTLAPPDLGVGNQPQDQLIAQGLLNGGREGQGGEVDEALDIEASKPRLHQDPGAPWISSSSCK